MRRIIFSTLLLFASVCAGARHTVGFDELTVDGDMFLLRENGQPFTGVAQGYYEASSNYIRAEVRDGKLHGRYEGYRDREMDSLWWECGMRGGKVHGTYLIYYPDGSLMTNLKYRRGNSGSSRSFYSEELGGGKMMYYRMRGTLGNRLKRSATFHYLQDGTPSSVMRMNVSKNEATGGYNHEKTGRYENFHANGMRAGKGRYRRDEEHGLWQYYRNNGQLRITDEFRDGKKNGWRHIYGDDGALTHKIHYADDKRDGWFYVYGDNGNLHSKALYVGDRPNGPEYRYSKDGSLRAVYHYSDGVEVRREDASAAYGRAAPLKPDVCVAESTERRIAYIELKNRDGVHYDPQGEPFTGIAEGALSVEGVGEAVPEEGRGLDFVRIYFRDGVAEGPFFGYWDSDLTVLRWVANHSGGKLHGSYVYYFRNGCKGFETNFRNGVQHGRRVCYFPPGKGPESTVMHRHRYRNDKQNGVLRTYFADGGAMERATFRRGVKQGRYRRFGEDGYLRYSGRYRDNESAGTWRYYREAGGDPGCVKFRDGKSVNHGRGEEMYLKIEAKWSEP